MNESMLLNKIRKIDLGTTFMIIYIAMSLQNLVKVESLLENEKKWLQKANKVLMDSYGKHDPLKC